MALRKLEIIINDQDSHDVENIVGEYPIIARYRDSKHSDRILFHVIIPDDECEKLLDELDRKYSGQSTFNVLISSLEGILPRTTMDVITKGVEERKASLGINIGIERVSREELYSEISDGVSISRTFIAMTILSAIVAAIGLIKDDTAIIIGAMVIAPLLTPNVGLALSTTLGDMKLFFRALKTFILALVIALVLSIFIGMMMNVDPQIPSVSNRLTMGFSDIVLAFSAGAAGSFAFTSSLLSPLIGVMVAVALMPPLVTGGLMVGSGMAHLSWGAFLLFFGNVICVNIAGILIFLIQGVRPRTWWEEEKANKAVKIAATFWCLLLALLVFIIYFTRWN